MSQSPGGYHLGELTMGEDSRVGYDHQKVAKIEQKTGLKENFNHNSHQNTFDQLWLTCNFVGDSSDCSPPKLNQVGGLLPTLGPKNKA